MSHLLRRCALAASFLLAIGSVQASPAPAAIDLVFYAPFLKQTPDGTVLNYRYVRQADDSKLEPSFEDDITLRVAPPEKADSVTVDLFTGARATKLQNLARSGNPLIVTILDRDVKEMSKLLGGSFYYIQNRIMEAMRSGEGVEPHKVEYDGKSFDGWKVTLRPFLNDRYRERLREFADITYELTFAEGVPGGLYGMKTLTPRPGDGKPLLVEQLQLQPVGAKAAASEGAK